VLIYEDAAHTILSDVLRFEDYGVGYVFVYSALDDGPHTLADTGMPTAFQANNISFTEQFNGSAYGLFGYTPTALSRATRLTFSTVPPRRAELRIQFHQRRGRRGVPDGGATIALLGMGLLAISALRRKLNV